MKLKKPNFIVVGTTKAGTTSLYHYLKQHPNICMSEKKETDFFINEEIVNYSKGLRPGKDYHDRIVHTKEDYLKLFSEDDTHVAIGEISPQYIYFYETAIKNITALLGDPKIIIILRNPVNRAFSSYLHLVREGLEDKSFDQSILEEKERIDDMYHPLWHYTQSGMYAEQVEAYQNAFKNVHVIIYEEMVKDRQATLKGIFKFLETNHYSIDTNTKHNVGGKPKNFISRMIITYRIIPKYISPILKRILPSKMITYLQKLYERFKQRSMKKPEMSTKEKLLLEKIFKKNIKDLERVLGRDLSSLRNI